MSAKVITPAFESVASPEGVTCVETPELLPKRILPLANSKPKSVLNVEGEFKSNEPTLTIPSLTIFEILLLYLVETGM